MELRSLSQAKITTGHRCREVRVLRGRRPRAGDEQTSVLSVVHNVFFAYEAIEVRARLAAGVSEARGEELCGRADAVLLAAGWGTAIWTSPAPGQWEAPAFDLADSDMAAFLEHALVGGKLYLTRHAEKIGRYLEHAGGPDLIERFTADIAREHPAMAASLDRAWQR